MLHTARERQVFCMYWQAVGYFLPFLGIQKLNRRRKDGGRVFQELHKQKAINMEEFYYTTGIFSSNILSLKRLFEDLKPAFYKISNTIDEDLKMGFPYFARMDFLCTESNVKDVSCLIRSRILEICKQDSNLNF